MNSKSNDEEPFKQYLKLKQIVNPLIDNLFQSFDCNHPAKQKN